MSVSTTRERDLIEDFKAADEALDAAKAKVKEAQISYDKIHQELFELMEAESKQTTAKYEGLGFVSMVKPKLRASVLKENEDKLFAFLQDKEREDLIKETVNPGSLSTFVGELIDAGEQLPEFIKYYMENKIKFYPR